MKHILLFSVFRFFSFFFTSLHGNSSRDPILTAFELSWELRRLSRMETEFRTEYNVFNSINLKCYVVVFFNNA